ncbi:hypothetical protein [Oceanobacillus piezotolerans]|nr:hypothetical protein [Oceanobacillus piezotolerans]
MMENIHTELQQASREINEAQEAVLQAQGRDEHLLEQAEQKIKRAADVLQNIQEHGGLEITKNSQFQQAYEELHDVRQQVQEAQQNNHDIL